MKEGDEDLCCFNFEVSQVLLGCFCGWWMCLGLFREVSESISPNPDRGTPLIVTWKCKMAIERPNSISTCMGGCFSCICLVMFPLTFAVTPVLALPPVPAIELAHLKTTSQTLVHLMLLVLKQRCCNAPYLTLSVWIMLLFHQYRVEPKEPKIFFWKRSILFSCKALSGASNGSSLWWWCSSPCNCPGSSAEILAKAKPFSSGRDLNNFWNTYLLKIQIFQYQQLFRLRKDGMGNLWTWSHVISMELLCFDSSV